MIADNDDYDHWRIQKFWNGGAKDNAPATSSCIANAHDELYTFYTEKKAIYWEKNAQVNVT